MGLTKSPLSRRALLRVCFAGLLISGPAPGQRSIAAGTLPSVGSWRRAVARLRNAETALAAAAGEPNEVAYARALGPFYEAARNLLHTPAPDLAGLALKMGFVADHGAELGRETCYGLLREEARQMLATTDWRHSDR